MNASPNVINGSEKLSDHFHRLEELLADLKHKVEASRASQVAHQAKAEKEQQRHPPDPAERGDRARAMLLEHGSITAADVQMEMGVSHATAMRTLQAIARAKGGVMVLEQAGPSFRVRLWHPDRVILDHVAR